VRKQNVQQGIAGACTTLNDLEVAVYHTEQLETVLADATAKGFPPAEHTTEQLQMCAKSLSTVTDSFRKASDATVEPQDVLGFDPLSVKPWAWCIGCHG
jgi:hypothetical protein